MARRNNSTTPIMAADIPALASGEAAQLARTEFKRLLALLESLSDGDWEQPTYCTEWNVRELTAHLAGAVTGSSRVSSFLHQSVRNPYIREFDQPIDGINQLQVEERSGSTPEELVDEFRKNGLRAVRNRERLPWLIRQIPLPLKPVGLKCVGYLVDIIYPRDQWMHRYDICAATGRRMVVTGKHDGRILDLVLRDIDRKLRAEFRDRRVDLCLMGEIGGDFQFGKVHGVNASLTMDVFDFHLLASGRVAVDEARARTRISGDRNGANWFLSHLEVAY